MRQKTWVIASLLVLVLALMSSLGLAAPKGKTVEFADGSQGKVVFSGTTHAEAGLKCLDCHNKIFPMKKSAQELKMAEINAGKYCGACHNGKKAFSTKDTKNCSKCHKK
jgi:c(7)-type cytochrome triheme protein